VAELSFCCANSRGSLLDRRVSAVADLSEAHDYAKALAQSLIETIGPVDWKSCRIHVLDDRGEEQFVMPCSWAAGRQNRRSGFFMSFWKKANAFVTPDARRRRCAGSMLNGIGRSSQNRGSR
jgi:hypothetical protein